MSSERTRHYQKFTAGAVMEQQVLRTTATTTVGSVRQQLQRLLKQGRSINYAYIVNAKGRLCGVVSIKVLFRAHTTTAIGSLATVQHLATVLPDARQHVAAHRALEFKIKEVPVVNKKNILLGVVPNNTILNILHRELHKDLLRFAGIHHAHAEFDDVLAIPLWLAIRHRLPWLVVGVFGGFVAAYIIDGFERILEEQLFLAAFIPLVVYISDAVGTQLEAFTIRDFTVKPTLSFVRYFVHQFRVVMVIALILAVIISGISFLLYLNAYVSIVLGITLLLAIPSALVSGLVVPFLFRTLHFDPANASGPIGTIIQNIVSVVIYFSIAFAIL